MGHTSTASSTTAASVPASAKARRRFVTSTAASGPAAPGASGRRERPPRSPSGIAGIEPLS